MVAVVGKRSWSLAALAAIALLGAGCSSDPGGKSESRGGSSDAGNSKGADVRNKAVKFAECMRNNGVPHFPDPDPKGETNFGVDVTPAVFKQAVAACKDLQPPGSLSSKRTPKEQSASLRFAACVRANGVKDFPDPVNGEPLIDTTKIPSSNRAGGMNILNAATHKCGNVLEKRAAGR
jgi:hypothetical protein